MTDRFYKKRYVAKYDLMINWISSKKEHKFHHLFHNTYKIIDSKKEIKSIIYFDHNGYLLEKYNKWDKSDERFFVCHNSNGHFQIVDSLESDPYSNNWKEYPIPKKETAIELCELLNSLGDNEQLKNEVFDWKRSAEDYFKIGKSLKGENEQLKLALMEQLQDNGNKYYIELFDELFNLNYDEWKLKNEYFDWEKLLDEVKE